MRRESRIWLLATTVLSGFVLATAFHYALGHYLRLGYPFETFLFRPSDRGNDFYNIFRCVVIGQPYASPTSVYFPFTYLPLYAVRFLDENLALTLLVALFTAVAGRLMWRSLSILDAQPRTLVTLILTLLTYPYIFCVDRGNLEMITFLFLAGFLAAYRRGRPVLAAVCLAAAAAMKGYPALFGLVLLARRQVRAFALMVVSTIVLTLGSAALYPGGIAGSFAKLQKHLATFAAVYVAPWGPSHFNPIGMQHNASYFGLARTLELMGLLPYPVVGWVEKLYLPLAAIAGLFVTVWIVFIERSLRRQLTLIAVAVIVLPQVSFDYKLILLLFPIAMYLEEGGPIRFDREWLIVFGLLLIPKSYAWIAGDITVSVILTPLLLTIAAGLAVAEGLTSRSAAAES